MIFSIFNYRIINYTWESSQTRYSSSPTTSITIGINPWYTPHSSEHCPKNTPSRSASTDTWLRRPGVASSFIPRLGTAKSWITSVLVTTKRTWVSTGSTIRLSTSSSRIWPSSRSLSGTIYESYSIASPASSTKSLYS